MAVVTVDLARASFVDPWTIAIGVPSAIVLVKWGPSSVWLVLAGAIAGIVRGAT